MATVVFSSAVSKSLLNNDRFAQALWKQALRRNIQQRRKTRGTYVKSYERVSILGARVIDTRSCSSVLLRDGSPGIDCATKPSCPVVSCISPVPSSFNGVISGTSLIHDRICPISGSWVNILNMAEPFQKHQVGFKLPVPFRSFRTSCLCHGSEKVPPRTPAVGTWEAVKGRKEKFREVKQDIIEDIKEKKAKVKEKMDAIIERENIWTVPNLLCISRIACSPFLCYMVMAAEYHSALGLFMFAGFTDLLDGWIARTFPSQASRLGSFLDPLADKILVALLFFSLTYVGLIPLPLTVIIIYRDIVIIGGASFVRYKSLPPPRTITRYFDATHATAQLAPTTLSKINTAIQLGLITASLAAPVFSFTDHYLLKALWWVTGATTISSGISYIFSKDTYKILSQMKKKS